MPFLLVEPAGRHGAAMAPPPAEGKHPGCTSKFGTDRGEFFRREKRFFRFPAKSRLQFPQTVILFLYINLQFPLDILSAARVHSAKKEEMEVNLLIRMKDKRLGRRNPHRDDPSGSPEAPDF
jgi:hypothetical protein